MIRTTTRQKDKTVSLIVTTYNSPDYLERSIRSVFDQTVLPGEIIIADDGSTDRTAEVIKELANASPVPLVHIWQPDQGFRAARVRNLAVAVTKGRYILMIDGDLILHKRYIEDHIHHRAHGYILQGSRIMLGPEITAKTLGNGKLKVDFFSRGIRGRIKLFRSRLISGLLRKRVFHKTKNQYRLAGGLMSCWKDDYMKVNGYDEQITGWGHEDDEFMVRMHFAGIRKRRIKFNCLTYHLHHPENNRNLASRNKGLVQQAVMDRKDRCLIGISQVIEQDASRHIRFSSRS